MRTKRISFDVPCPDGVTARRIARWLLPTPGNALFTMLVIGVLVWVQMAGAAPWARPVTQSVGASATTVNYQGKLADSAGTPLDGTYSMSFALYDAATEGEIVWGPEVHGAVAVSGGLFSVGLGSQTDGGIPTTTWNGDRYLEIAVNGETLMPRELMRSVPIAGMALTVPDGSITTEKMAEGAVTLADLGIARYRFSRDAESTIYYTGPTGEETSLDLSTCSPEWCCNAENTICYGQSEGEDSILEFSLQGGAPSIMCTLLHDEDDSPGSSKGLYYATDGGNSGHIGGPAARLSREGISGIPIDNARRYAWLCVH